jgi:adenylate kinase
VATGDLLRNEVQAGTELGRRAKVYMDQGELVPDEITLELVRRRLGRPDCERGVLLDGFPRTVAQARELDRMLGDLGRRMDHVLFLRVPESVLVRRLAGRLTCPSCGRTYHVELAPPKQDSVCDLDGTPLVQREDDRPETARRRITVYLEQTLPVLEHYREQDVVSDVDGVGSIEEVQRHLLAAIEARCTAGDQR